MLLANFPLQIWYGSLGRILFSLSVPQCGAGLNANSSPVYINEPQNSNNLCLMYAMQAWAFTAGKAQYSAINSLDPISGQGSFPAPSGTIGRLDLAFSAAPTTKYALTGTKPYRKLGWVQFVYGNYTGPLIPVNFLSQAIFPSEEGATGVSYSLNEGATATPTVYTRAATYCPINYTTGGGADPLNDANVAADYTNLGEFTAQGWDLQTLQVPVINSGVLQETTLTDDVIRTYGDANAVTDWAPQVVLLALLNEIWNATAARRFPDTTQPAIAASGADFKQYTAAYVRRVEITIQEPIPDSKAYEYSGGLPFYGYFCFLVDGIQTQCQFINAQQAVFFPNQAEVSGVWWNFPPGITASVVIYTAGDQVKGMFTKQGQVNLAKGVTSGLIGLAT